MEHSTLHLGMMEERGRKEERSGGAAFAAPLCPRISLCNLRNHRGDDDTLSLQSDLSAGDLCD